MKDIIDAALAIPGQTDVRELEWLYKLATLAPPGLLMVELGTFRGRTAAVLCEAGKEIGSEVVTIDDYTQSPHFSRWYKVYTNNSDHKRITEEHAEVTKKNLAMLGFEPRVVIGDSAKVPEGIEEIGLLFIDSEHTAPRFNAECDTWLPLLATGGILACHDYEQPQWAEMTPAINERIRLQTNEWEYLGLQIWLVGFKRIGRSE